MLELRSCKPKQDNSTPNILGFRVIGLVRYVGSEGKVFGFPGFFGFTVHDSSEADSGEPATDICDLGFAFQAVVIGWGGFRVVLGFRV